MSEKVMLTAEQAEALEQYKSDGHNIAIFVAKRSSFHGLYLPLKELSIDDMAKSLYIGYEIKQPKFQSGDKVIYKDEALDDEFDRNKVFTLKDKHQVLSGPRSGEKAWKIGEYLGDWDLESNFRHATPEEIYWLETLGREKVGDFRIGDQYVYSDSDRSFKIDVPERIEVVEELYAAGKLIGIYPAESFKAFPKEDAE